jgi:subtilisin family serine protease
MKSRFLAFIVLTVILLEGFAQAQKGMPFDGKHIVPGRVLIKLKANQPGVSGTMLRKAASTQSLLQKIGATKQETIFSEKNSSPEKMRIAEEVGLDRWIIATVPVVVELRTLINQLRQDPIVEIAEPDYICTTNAIPNDSLYSSQLHLPQIKAPQAWDIAKGDSTVVIAIIDTGVDWDHPDLASVIWNNPGETGLDALGRDKRTNGIDDDGDGYIDDWHGWDFVSGIVGGKGTTDPDPNDDLNIEDNNPMDYEGHGTHCAGIAGAATNNRTGIASIAWGCKIMPLRIGFRTNDGSGSGFSSWMARAFQYAADNGVSVASLSFSSSGKIIIDASLYAFKRGVVICNAAGNANTETAGALGTVPWVLSVAAVSDLDQKASYSSYGTWVNISAPGGDQNSGRPGILSTIVNPSPYYSGNLYVSFQGTSMACPLVAGMAGLVRSKFKTLDAPSTVFQICATADNIDGSNSAYAGKLGYGRINAQNAVTTIVPPMKPVLSINSTLFDDGLGNGNGKVEPGETIKMTINLKNVWENATNVSATVSTTSWGITISKPAASYGTIPGIRDVDNSIKGNSADKFVFSVSSDSVPRTVAFKVSLFADQGYTKDFMIYVSVLPSLLFVDDDDGSANVEQYYLDAFQNIGLGCDYWNRLLQGPLTANQLSAYKTVVWGCEWAFPSLDSTDRSAIGGFLDNGGQLFLAGQDIAWELCDTAGTEYENSSGASKTWFEKYFKASYQSDNANTTTITGVTGDPIGDGLTLAFKEPLRTSTQQFPDVISPLSSAQSVFKYPAGTSGAIRYTGTWKVVYFGFGGFEAITSASSRTTVMDRIFKWFTGYQLLHTPLKDTESPDSQKVQVNISSTNSIQSVNLYWDIDGSFPFKKKPMKGIGGGTFEAYIPGQTNISVQYTVIVSASGGFMPYTLYNYRVGADVTPPVFLSADTLGNTLSASGSYSATLSADDNTSLDTNAAYIYFKYNTSALDSVKLSYKGANVFSGPFTLSKLTSQIRVKDSVSYYYSIRDASIAHNKTKLPATGFYTFLIGRQMIDSFEKIRQIWNFGLGWGYEQSTRSSIVTNAMSDSPYKTYTAGTENILTLTQPFNMSPYTYGRMYFWRAMSINTTDTLYIEYNKGDGNWISARTMNGTFPNTWRKDSVDLQSSSSSTTFRFRLKANGSTGAQGILLDDIEVVGNTFLPTGVKNDITSGIPRDFALEQNYPNPFNPSTAIRYQLPTRSQVILRVYDMLGREISLIDDGMKEAGTYTISFDASHLASGLYLYRIIAGNNISTKKMILLK